MKYVTSKTVESVMEAYDADYNSRKPNAKPASSVNVETIDENTNDPRIERIQQMFIDKTMTTNEYIDSIDLSEPEYLAFTTDQSTGKKRIIEYTLGDVDAKFPRHEWIQMLLDKGVKIENYKEYQEFLDIRKSLFTKEHLTEDKKNLDQSEYINQEIQRFQRIHEARRTNPEVDDWIVIGENALPAIPGRMYVCKTESGYKIKFQKTSNDEPKLTDEQKTDLQNKGVEPEGWEVVYIDEKGDTL